MPPTEEQAARFSQRDEGGAFEWRNLRHEGSNSDRDARRALYYPIYISGTTIRVPKMVWDEQAEEWIVQEKPRPGEQVVLPDNEAGEQKTWRWEAMTVMSSLSQLAVRKDRSGKNSVYYKRRPHEEGVVSVSSWFDAKFSATEHGTALLKAMFGKPVFSYPKSIHAMIDAIYVAGASKPDTWVLDYFAGSGTTGHAVINLNREDGGGRKFILVEIANYFPTVLLPRIKKGTFTPEWKDGKPKRMVTQEEAERSPRIVKYMLKWEMRKSETLLNVEKLACPFSDKLHIHADGRTHEKVADVPETFNYLLGLHVQTRRVLHDGDRRSLVYRGRIDHQQIVVTWRETECWQKADLERDQRFGGEKNLTEGADEIFVNGDSFIPNTRPLEPVFKAKMFAEVQA